MTAGNANEACDVIYPRSVHELDTQEPRSYVFVRGYSFRSHYDREALMRTKGFLLILIAGLGVALICPELSLLRGQAPTSVGLTGQVSSKEEGPMEGVVVSAKRAGSTITVSVVTHRQGRYRFPRERMEPGQYSLKMRAAGYDLDDVGPVEITPDKTATADLKLHKAKDLSSQLTNAEWLLSIPGTEEQKSFLLNCMTCRGGKRCRTTSSWTPRGWSGTPILESSMLEDWIPRQPRSLNFRFQCSNLASRSASSKWIRTKPVTSGSR